MQTLSRIEETALSTWFRESGAAFFSTLTLHSLAMAIVVGINFAIAFRLMGWVPQFALSPYSRFYQIHWMGVIVIFLSGTGLLLAYPAKALTNPIFYLKFIALTIGLIIAAWIQNRLDRSSITEREHHKFKLIAMASILLWVITITAGRFLAYTHSVLLASRFF